MKHSATNVLAMFRVLYLLDIHVGANLIAGSDYARANTLFWFHSENHRICFGSESCALQNDILRRIVMSHCAHISIYSQTL